jgi:hypothetical protein
MTVAGAESASLATRECEEGRLHTPTLPSVGTRQPELAIVSEELWNAVQARLKSLAEKRGSNRPFSIATSVPYQRPRFWAWPHNHAGAPALSGWRAFNQLTTTLSSRIVSSSRARPYVFAERLQFRFGRPMSSRIKSGRSSSALWTASNPSDASQETYTVNVFLQA